MSEAAAPKVKVTMSEAIRQAIDTQDYKRAGKICDILRLRWGMTYQNMVDYVRDKAQRDPAAWEDLLMEADDAESRSTQEEHHSLVVLR